MGVDRGCSQRPKARRWASAGWLVLGLTVAIAAGCEEESDESEEIRAAREAMCRGGCAASARCEDSNPDCTDTCMQSTDGYFLRMNPDALTAQADCLAQTTSCVDGVEELFSSCAEQAWLDFPATEAALETCELMAASLFECGWFDSLDQCASYFAIYSAPALQDWQSCEGVFDCEALDQCSAATLYDYGN